MNKTECDGCGELIFAYNAIEWKLCSDCEEFFHAAPEKIARLQAENARLRAALEKARGRLEYLPTPDNAEEALEYNRARAIQIIDEALAQKGGAE